MRDTCEIHVSSEVIKIHARYMRDTCGDTCSDTCGTRISGVRGDVHVLMPSWRAAHLSGHTHVFLVQKWVCSSSTLQLLHLLLCHGHPYPRSTRTGCTRTGVQGVQGQAQAVGLEIRILECIPYVSDMYRECILCAMYLRVKIHCILNVS